NTVGIERIWNAAAICGSFSVSTLASRKAPPYSAASFSRTGPRVRQGPHHSAQKSTSTGTSSDFCRTSASKVAVVASKPCAAGSAGRGGSGKGEGQDGGAGPGFQAVAGGVDTGRRRCNVQVT